MAAGSIANSGAALGEGLNAGAQFGNSVIQAARGRQQYQEDQTAHAKSGAQIDDVANSGMAGIAPSQGDGQDPNAAQNTAAHTSFLQSLGQGLAHVGTGINNFFAGAPINVVGASPGAAPASGLPAQPGAGAATALPAGANPQAAPVGLPQAPGAPTAGVAGGAPAYMADGGPVPAPGVGALGAGLNAGAQFGNSVVDAARSRQQYQQDQSARGAQGAAIDDIANHPVEQFAAHLHDAALDDKDVPNSVATNAVGLPQSSAAAGGAPAQGSPPVQGGAAPAAGPAPPGAAANPGPNPQGASGAAPPPNPAQVQGAQLLASVAKNPAAQQGLPEKGATDTDANVAGSGGATAAHSITPEWWDHNDKLMLQAASAAARAGHDPDQVYSALNHMRTSFVQGHMLRAASAASVALQNGDMDAVEQNLRNMNYYLPDGKDLNVQKQGGQLVYQNPLQQFVDATGQPTNAPKGTDGKPNQPNMIPVDQAHIQMLGQAILDPMKVNDTLMATRAAAAKQQLEASQAQAATMNAQGHLATGQARLQRVGSQNIKDLSAAQLDQAKAATAGYAMLRWKAQIANQKLDPSLLKGAAAAGSAVDDALLGTKTAAPINDADGNPSLSPAAGKVVHDPKTVPKELQNVTSLESGELKATAGDLYISNMKTGMSPTQAAQITLQIRNSAKQTHKGSDGKPQPNAYVHRAQGEVGVWNQAAGRYDKYTIGQQTAANLGSPMDESEFIRQGLAQGPSSGGAATGNQPDNNTDDDENSPNNTAPAQ